MRRTAGGVRFRDRAAAGRALAARLVAWRGVPGAVVLGLPRGGVVPAAEIALDLGLPLDVLISRKLRSPYNPELAIGALAEGGEIYVVASNRDATGATDDWLASEKAAQQAEIDKRRLLFRDGRPLDLPARATVILVDDGVATGSTVVAAIHALRRQGAVRIVLATPVAPADTAARLGALVDELVVLDTPEAFRSVGEFYEDFEQVSDDEVLALLENARHRQAAGAAPGPGNERWR